MQTIRRDFLKVVGSMAIGGADWARRQFRDHAYCTLVAYKAAVEQALSGGERNMLSIARALTLDADCLLLDEPFEGLSPAMIPTIREGLHAIMQTGRSIPCDGSNIHHISDYADRLYVLERERLSLLETRGGLS